MESRNSRGKPRRISMPKQAPASPIFGLQNNYTSGRSDRHNRQSNNRQNSRTAYHTNRNHSIHNTSRNQSREKVSGRISASSGSGAAILHGGTPYANQPNKSGNLFTDCIDVFKNKSMGFDSVFFWLIILILGIGIGMLYSASYAYAYYFRHGNSEFFLNNQLFFALIGGIGMFVVSLIPPRYFYNWMWAIFIVQLILIIAVYAFPPINSVHRWIIIGPFNFQPSEITKFSIILFCARWCTMHKDKMNNPIMGMITPALFFVPCLILVAFERHLSCAVLLLLIFFTMMFMGGSNIKWFIALGIVVVIGVIALVFSDSIPVIGDRLAVWRDPFVDVQGDGWQNIQALYAISSGGILGQGIGNSRQKYLYVSEPQNDFIFSVVAEELGFVGSVVIIIIFAAIVWRGFVISMSNPDRFQKLVGIGITAQIGWQVILNIAVVTKVVPNTGISLPFFSAGGTSLAMLMMQVGVLLAISRNSTIKKT